MNRDTVRVIAQIGLWTDYVLPYTESGLNDQQEAQRQYDCLFAFARFSIIPF